MEQQQKRRQKNGFGIIGLRLSSSEESAKFDFGHRCSELNTKNEGAAVGSGPLVLFLMAYNEVLRGRGRPPLPCSHSLPLFQGRKVFNQVDKVVGRHCLFQAGRHYRELLFRAPGDLAFFIASNQATDSF